MIRALVKGTGLALFGISNSGEKFYRYITRDILDTQRSHIIKLHRVWPGTFRQIQEVYGRSLNKKTICIHEVGWTPFWPCINFLVSGSGGVLVNTGFLGSTLLMRHLVFAINQTIDLVGKLHPGIKVPQKRIDLLNSLRWSGTLDKFLDKTDSRYVEGCEPAKLPIQDESVDIIYSGGQLEHYPEPLLRKWLGEALRVLKPGGLLAPVFDHRDHLYHFDHGIPFLNHYRYPDFFYNTTHRSRLLYHNRMTPQQTVQMFEQSGFTKLKLRRLVLPENSWIDEEDDLQGSPGLERNLLSKRFNNISEADLHTAAGHYIFEKPKAERRNRKGR